MSALPEDLFPPPIDGLLKALSDSGFFERSLLIGSWVMPIYQELYGIRYVLRTFDVDFAVSLAHPRKKLRQDLEHLITDLGFIDFIGTDGTQKFTAGGYEVEFIAHRPGGRDIGTLPVGEWNLNAMPLPFINILTDFSETADFGQGSIRFPAPEAYFLHKLIIAPRRLTAEKRGKDLEQCAAIAPIIERQKLLAILGAQRFGKATRTAMTSSCDAIGFPLHTDQ